jgi:hypothetical protein
MTIPTTTVKVHANGDDIETLFPYAIYTNFKDDLTVVISDENNEITWLKHGVDYVFTEYARSNGIIQYPKDDELDPLPTGWKITITLKMNIQQTTAFANKTYLPKIYDDAADELMLVTQSQQEELDRCTKLDALSVEDFEILTDPAMGDPSPSLVNPPSQKAAKTFMDSFKDTNPLLGDSTTKAATQKAVKTYADNLVINTEDLGGYVGPGAAWQTDQAADDKAPSQGSILDFTADNCTYKEWFSEEYAGTDSVTLTGGAAVEDIAIDIPADTFSEVPKFAIVVASDVTEKFIFNFILAGSTTTSLNFKVQRRDGAVLSAGTHTFRIFAKVSEFYADKWITGITVGNLSDPQLRGRMLYYNGLVYFHTGGSGPGVVAINAKTGEEVWRWQEFEMCPPFQGPDGYEPTVYIESIRALGPPMIYREQGEPDKIYWTTGEWWNTQPLTTRRYKRGIRVMDPMTGAPERFMEIGGSDNDNIINVFEEEDQFIVFGKSTGGTAYLYFYEMRYSPVTYISAVPVALGSTSSSKMVVHVRELENAIGEDFFMGMVNTVAQQTFFDIYTGIIYWSDAHEPTNQEVFVVDEDMPWWFQYWTSWNETGHGDGRGIKLVTLSLLGSSSNYNTWFVSHGEANCGEYHTSGSPQLTAGGAFILESFQNTGFWANKKNLFMMNAGADAGNPEGTKMWGEQANLGTATYMTLDQSKSLDGYLYICSVAQTGGSGYDRLNTLMCIDVYRTYAYAPYPAEHPLFDAAYPGVGRDVMNEPFIIWKEELSHNGAQGPVFKGNYVWVVTFDMNVYCFNRTTREAAIEALL